MNALPRDTHAGASVEPPAASDAQPPVWLLQGNPKSRRERARRAFEQRLYCEVMDMPFGPKWKLAVALVTEHGYLKRFLRRRLHLATPLDTHDRRILEQIIFPGYLADNRIRRVLFVGCDNYTAHYEAEFFADVDFWTIEPDPQKRRYGARQHLVGTLEHLDEYFAPGSLDLILCNGVFGWGLNTAEQCEAAFGNCHTCLARGGHLMIGWDDAPGAKLTSTRLGDLDSLSRFERFRFPVLGTWKYVTDTPYRHTYEFYRKP